MKLDSMLSGRRPNVGHEPAFEAITKTAEFRLPIFKQGDDLGHCLAEEDTLRDALLAYAGMLNEARDMVLGLAECADQIEIPQADTHFIVIEGPGKLIEELIQRGLLSPDQEDDYEE